MVRDRESFPRAAEKRAARRRRARSQRDNVWFGLGMFGLVGWSVAIPTLIGIAVGAWLDGRGGESQISWTLTGLGVGLAVGCALAWWWVRQESRHDPGDPEDLDDPDPRAGQPPTEQPPDERSHR